jgi:hypothetical protein
MDSHRGRPNGSGVVWPSAKTVYALRACAEDLRNTLSRTASLTLRNTSIADLAEQLDQAAPA